MRIAFLFSGQGAQIPGMMQDIVEHYDASKKIFECADNTLGRSISKLTFNGTDEELLKTHNTQPCVLAADLAAAKALESCGVYPAAVAGFSLGEYAALVTAKVMSPENAFKLIQIRADAMQVAVPLGEGAMAAFIGCDATQVEALCAASNNYVIPANYNSPNQTVVSGTISGVEEVISQAEKKGIKAIKLAVSAPFHCKLMEPAADTIRQEIKKIEMNDPIIPVYMNVDARVLSGANDIPDLLYLQAMSAVRWKQIMLNMYEDGIDTFIECGPGKVLWGLARKTLPKGTAIYRVSDIDTLNITLSHVKEQES